MRRPLKPGCREAGRPRLKTQQTRPFPPEAPQAAAGHNLRRSLRQNKNAAGCRACPRCRKQSKGRKNVPMKPQYFDSQKAAAIISEPNDDRRSLMVDALRNDEAKLLCTLLLEFVPRKGRRKRSTSGRSIERAHCMRANEKEGWFAVKKLPSDSGHRADRPAPAGDIFMVRAVRNAAALNPLVAEQAL